MLRKTPFLALMLIALLLAVSCRVAPDADTTGSVTIFISDNTPKLIQYDGAGGSNITHYLISIESESGISQPSTSGYQPAVNDVYKYDYTITGLINDDYTITVGGYIKTGAGNIDSDYHKVAEDSVTVHIDYADKDQSVELILETLIDEPSGPVTIETMMPLDYVDPVTHTITGTLSWRIMKADDPSTSIVTDSETLTDVLLTEGNREDGNGMGWYHTFTASESLDPGLYLIYAEFAGDGGYTYASMNAIRALPGLNANGQMILDRAELIGYDFSVVDGIGDKVEVSAENDTYTLGPSEGFTIALTGSPVVSAPYEMIWFIDGVYTEDVTEGEDGYAFDGFTDGSHHVTGIVYDTEKASSIGSISITVSVTGEATIGPATGV